MPHGFLLDSDSVAQLALRSMSMPALFSGILPTVMTAMGESWCDPEQEYEGDGWDCKAIHC